MMMKNNEIFIFFILGWVLVFLLWCQEYKYQKLKKELILCQRTTCSQR